MRGLVGAGALLLLLVHGGGLAAEAGNAPENVSARSFDDLVGEADAAFAREDYGLARELYERALESRPDALHPLRRLALLQSWEGDLEESEATYRRVLDLEPGDPEIGLDLARVVSWQNDLDRAIDLYEDLRIRQPEEARVLLGLAQVLSWKGRYAEAEAIYVEMQDKKIEPILAHLGRARIRGWQGHFDDASRFYHDVLRASPGNLEARVGMVRIRHWEGLNRSARDQIDNIVLDHPEDREARELQAEIHRALRPRGSADGYRFSDNDGNRVDVGTIATTFMAEPQTPIRIALTAHAAEFRCEEREFCDEVAPPAGTFSEVASAEAATLIAGLTSLVIRSLTFHARVGVVWEEDLGEESRTFGIGGGFIRWQVGPRLALRGSLAREALLDTALLIDRGIRVDAADALIEYRLNRSWTLSGSAGLASYSDGNARQTAGITLGWTLRPSHPGVSALLDARYRSFNEDKNNGYFDPLRYDSELLTVAIWDDYRRRRIFWRVEGTIGRQDFDTDARGSLEAGTDDTVQAIHARLGLTLGERATLEAFYSRSDYALEIATGFTSTRSGFAFGYRF
jgi:tetratricopeptide (TPR) repeat protein